MLAHLIRIVSDRTFVLEKYLSIFEACDEVEVHPEEPFFKELTSRFAIGPKLAEERVFRHCAIVTQLYSIYETFIEETLNFWLTRVPRYQSFSDLPQTFRNAYRNGIARILRDADKRRYRHLSLRDVLEKYSVSLSGESHWEFVCEALTTHENNLRRSEFEKMFNSVGLNGIWASLEQNPSLLSQTLDSDSNKSLERMIEDLVTFRNDASHGAPDEILGVETLRDWIAFVRAFCNALVEFMIHRIISEEKTHRPESVLGIVTETFSDNIIVATCKQGVLNIGDQIFFWRTKDCINARIESLQVNDVDYMSVEIDHEEYEVGIQTSLKVSDGSYLVRMSVQ